MTRVRGEPVRPATDGSSVRRLQPAAPARARPPRSRRAQSTLDAVIGMVVVLALELPTLLTSRAFFADWGNHLFLVKQQADWLDSHLLPTFFVHTVESGAFYPHYLFYGGTLYSATARLGTIIGVVAAYKLSFVAALAAAYFGTIWISRLLGVRGLAAHLPAIAAVSGAYYLSTQYYAGDWPEFIALSMIPLVVAAAVSLLIGRNHPIGPTVALVVGAVFLTGSHNITTEYGLIFLALLFVMIAATVRARSINWRRAALVGSSFVLSIGVNAWFLLPAVQYAHLTSIGSVNHFADFDRATRAFESFAVVFDPGRYSPTVGHQRGSVIYVQQPVFVVLWLVLLGVFVVGPAAGRARRMFLGLATVTAIYLTLLFWSAPWDIAPRILQAIQFRFRLSSYVGFCVVGLVVIGLTVLQRRRTGPIWTLALALACATAFVASAWQVWAAPTYEALSVPTSTGTSLPRIDYAGCPAPCPTVETDYRIGGSTKPSEVLAASAIDIAAARSGSVTFDVAPGQLTAVNVAWSPIVQSTEGAPIVGADARGRVVVDSRGAPAGKPVRTRIAFHSTTATTAGIAITALCCLALLGLLGVGIVGLRRPRSRPRARPPARSGASAAS